MNGTIPPSFEDHTSPLTRSNDGVLQIDRSPALEGGKVGYVVSDHRSDHVQLFALKRETADAFVAGYDYAKHVPQQVEVDARADAERFFGTPPSTLGSHALVEALSVILFDARNRNAIDAKALEQARAALGLDV